MKYYTLMNKHIPVLEFELDIDTAQIYKIVKLLNPEYAPLSIIEDCTRAKLVNWWKDRAIPINRSGLREALYLMNGTNTEKLLLKSYGLSLSDQYWIKETNSDLQWNEINFFTNSFSDDAGEALFGRKDKDMLDLCSPCNTTNGWLKKKWKILNHKRVLLKSGSGSELQEPLNEVIASRILAQSTVTNYVEYSLFYDKTDRPLSLCENFITEDTEFIPACTIIKILKKNNNDSYITHYIKCCEKLGIPKEDTEEFLSDMLTFDYLICNQDRHYNNFGIIREVNTLEIIGHAPIFDHGTSLWNGIATNFIRFNGPYESKPFKSDHEDQIKLVQKSDKFKIDQVDNIVRSVMDLSAYVENTRIDKIAFSLGKRMERFLLNNHE